MQPSVLIIKPAQNGPDHAGDEVVNRRAIAALSEHFVVDLVEIQPNNLVQRLIALASGLPPELSRFASSANIELVRRSVESHKPDLICFLHEVTFPSIPGAAGTAVGRMLYAHNIHSVIADTEHSPIGKAFAGAARRFEQRWCCGEEGALVCISIGDAEYLRDTGVNTGPIAVAAPGPPPLVPLAADATIMPQLVITGSYGWWRKRRDLRLFAAEAGSETAYVSDPLAAELIPNSVMIGPQSLDWGDSIRFGVITDRFVGGFKLKALEYIAKNCAILSYADISREFEGMPHADEFVRIVKNRAEISAILVEAMIEPQARVARFLAFKRACLDQYDWKKTMGPLVETARFQAAAGENLVQA